MPLIKVEKETPKVSKKITFEKEVMDDIELYANLLSKDTNNSDVVNLIVNEGMKYFFSKDKDFVKYKKEIEKQRNKSDLNNEANTEIKTS